MEDEVLLVCLHQTILVLVPHGIAATHGTLLHPFLDSLLRTSLPLLVVQLPIRSSECLGHAFHCVSIPRYVHAGDTGDLSNATTELLVARRHNKASPLLRHLHQTIIGIASFAAARNTLESRVFRQSQCDLVLSSELLQLSHHTIGNARGRFRQQAVHHGSNDIQLFPVVDRVSFLWSFVVLRW